MHGGRSGLVVPDLHSARILLLSRQGRTDYKKSISSASNRGNVGAVKRELRGVTSGNSAGWRIEQDGLAGVERAGRERVTVVPAYYFPGTAGPCGGVDMRTVQVAPAT